MWFQMHNDVGASRLLLGNRLVLVDNLSITPGAVSALMHVIPTCATAEASVLVV